VETIGSKRSYALIWCMPNNDDDDHSKPFLLISYHMILWTSVRKFRSDRDLNTGHGTTVTEHLPLHHDRPSRHLRSCQKTNSSDYYLVIHHIGLLHFCTSALEQLPPRETYLLTALLLFTDSSTVWRLISILLHSTDIVWLLATSVLMICQLTMLP